MVQVERKDSCKDAFCKTLRNKERGTASGKCTGICKWAEWACHWSRCIVWCTVSVATVWLLVSLNEWHPEFVVAEAAEEWGKEFCPTRLLECANYACLCKISTTSVLWFCGMGFAAFLFPAQFSIVLAQNFGLTFETKESSYRDTIKWMCVCVCLFFFFFALCILSK